MASLKKEQQEKIITLVDRILSAKKLDPQSDTSALEAEIDRLVYDLYGLTEDDITPTYQSFGDSADALKDGKIDAAFICAGAPTTAVTDVRYVPTWK